MPPVSSVPPIGYKGLKVQGLQDLNDFKPFKFENALNTIFSATMENLKISLLGLFLAPGLRISVFKRINALLQFYKELVPTS